MVEVSRLSLFLLLSFNSGSYPLIHDINPDYKEGGESFKVYNGRHIASTTNTVVLFPNYRIGPLGFFFSGTPEVDANVGVQDQRWAIQWAHDNAPAFGASPHNITIFGQSAGGESVLLHVTNADAPRAVPFQKAIVESGPINLFLKHKDDATMLAKETSLLCNCGPLDVECMRKVPVQQFLDASKLAVVIPHGASEAIMRFAPVVDGVTVKREPYDAYANRTHVLNVPMIAGSNLNDGILFSYAISPKKPIISVEYAAIVAGIFQTRVGTERVLEAYPPDLLGDNRKVLAELVTDYFFACPTRWLLRQARAMGHTNTFLYRFSHQPPFHVWPESKNFCNVNVCHGDEIPYVFADSGNPFPWNLTAADALLANAMSTYWTTFASTGAPAGGPIAWPTTAKDQSMELQWPLSIKTGLLKSNCDLLESVGFKHGVSPYNVMMHV